MWGTAHTLQRCRRPQKRIPNRELSARSPLWATKSGLLMSSQNQPSSDRVRTRSSTPGRQHSNSINTHNTHKTQTHAHGSMLHGWGVPKHARGESAKPSRQTGVIAAHAAPATQCAADGDRSYLAVVSARSHSQRDPAAPPKGTRLCCATWGRGG